MLTMERVGFAYGSRVILDDAGATFGPGTATALMGPSGSGKTTLLRLLDGTLRPQSGTIRLDSTDIADIDPSEMHGSICMRVFQDYRLIPYLSVRDNIMLAVEASRGARRRARKRKRDKSRQTASAAAKSASTTATPPAHTVTADTVDALLDQVHLTGYANREAGALSGGEQQRVAIARALVLDPRVILADEPTGALDEENTAVVARLLADIAHEHDASVVIATHDPVVARSCDRILRLHEHGLVAS